MYERTHQQTTSANTNAMCGTRSPATRIKTIVVVGHISQQRNSGRNKYAYGFGYVFLCMYVSTEQVLFTMIDTKKEEKK